jgi:biopolymer transport protein ExbD
MASLGAQTFKVGTFHKHLLKRKQKRAGRRRVMIAGLTLTSMVDMFSLLVIFLLQTFSTSPELVMVTKGMTLPSAITSRELDDAPVLSISSEGVFLDQHLIGTTEALLANPTVLMNKLADLRELWQKTHPKDKFKGVISLQADRNMPSTVVSQFMGMLPTQAYSSVQLAVVSRGGS